MSVAATLAPRALPPSVRLPLHMQAQPDEVSCGPMCLQAVYQYWGDPEPTRDVIERLNVPRQRGTFAVFLACDALRKGYAATIYTYNLTVFDPTWFVRGGDIAERLRRQRDAKRDARLNRLTEGYLEFLERGGRLRLVDLSRPLIRGLLRRRLPVITGLCSTYLYRARREYGRNDTPDDVRGYPSGHFVVRAGYDRTRRSVLIADPYGPHPYGPSLQYWLSIDRVLGAVLLGILTHDANLLVIHPRERR